MPETTEMTPRPCVCTSIRKAARVLARTYDASLAPSGMNVTQLAVLRAVLRHPGEPLSRVAEDLAMDRTSLYRAIEAMKKQRWVTLREGQDQRSRSASVTKSGGVTFGKAGQEWATTQRAIVRQFGEVRWQSFVSELQALIDCASSIDGQPQVSGEIT